MILKKIPRIHLSKRRNEKKRKKYVVGSLSSQIPLTLHLLLPLSLELHCKTGFGKKTTQRKKGR
jgi:hypothetical protein